MNLLNHPKHYIKKIITSHVSNEWALIIEPRVVRQLSQKVEKNLEHIDYAFPCFEVAHKLNISPAEVARTLANRIRKDKPLINGARIHVEAINGYLNFQIDNELIRWGKELAMNWSEGIKYGGLKDYNLAILGSDLADESLTIFGSYLPDLYQLYGRKVQIVDVYKSMFLEYKRQKQVNSISSDVIRHIEEKINKLLEKHATENNKFITDNKTLAMFYMNDEIAIPLRSASGSLQKPAFYFYAIDHIINSELKHSQNVILASQKEHQFLHDIIPEKYSFIIVDPVVMRPDISEFLGSGFDFNTYMKNYVDSVLQLEKEVDSSQQRRDFLALVDLPYDLAHALQSGSLPAIFNSLNESLSSFVPANASLSGVSHG